MVTKPYAVDGNSQSEQAEHSSANPAAGNIQMRMLIEMQLQTIIMAEAFDFKEDLQEVRQSIADEIT